MFAFLGFLLALYQVYRCVVVIKPQYRLRNLREKRKNRIAHQLSVDLEGRPELPVTGDIRNDHESREGPQVVQYDSQGTTLEGSGSEASKATTPPDSVRAGHSVNAGQTVGLEAFPTFDDRYYVDEGDYVGTIVASRAQRPDSTA